jgi:hypothetical protein
LEYDADGKLIYFVDSNGYWSRREYDNNGNLIYYEDSTGYIEDNRHGINEGLNLVKKPKPAQFMEPTPVIVYPEGSVMTVPYHVVQTLKYDGIVFFDDEWTRERPEGQWGINEENSSILEYYVDYQKLPPKYNDDQEYIKVGDNIIADIDGNEFQAYVEGFRGEYISIRDGDGDYFDVEPHEITFDFD